MALEEVTIGKLGIIGALLVVASKAIHMLWRHGEDKALDAQRERDKLREEREHIREQHAAEIAELRFTHEQELARVRIEALQQINDVRASTTSRMEELLIEVTRFTSSLEPTLQKLFERLRR